MKKSYLSVVFFLFAAVMALLFVPESANAATYTPIAALPVTRIQQNDDGGECHRCSLATLEAYAYCGRSFSYGNKTDKYPNSLGTDIPWSSSAMWQKIGDNGGVGAYKNLENLEYPIYTVTGKSLSQVMTLAYEHLSAGSPVVIYNESSNGVGSHASVIIGYTGNGNTLDASKFVIMEIKKSGPYWYNTPAYANNPMPSDQNNWSNKYEASSCYVTLSTWAAGRSNFVVHWMNLGRKITVNAEHGTVSGLNKSYYKAGDTVTLTFTPEYGYTYPVKWTCSDSGVTLTSVASGDTIAERVASQVLQRQITFTMPNHDITIKAVPTRDKSANTYNWKNVKTMADYGLVSATFEIETGEGGSLPSALDFYVIASPTRSNTENAKYNAPGNAYVKKISMTRLPMTNSYYLPLLDLREGLKNSGGSTMSIADYTSCYYKFVSVADGIVATSPIGVCGKQVVISKTQANSKMPYNGSPNCLFWCELRYQKNTMPKEEGIFVGMDEDSVRSATVGSYSGTKKVSETASTTSTDNAAYDYHYLFYNASSSGFSGYTFTNGTTYYFKFYGISSDGCYHYGPVISYVYGSSGTGTRVIEQTVPVTGIILSASSKNVSVGSSAFTLTCTVSPADATDRSVIWASSDTSVAKVNNGVVTPVGAGTAVISATAADGSGVTASCTVTVSPIKATGLSLNRTTDSVSIAAGSYTLTANVTPSDTTNKTLTWTSSDTSVATVSGGVVTLLTPGTVTVTAATQDGSGLTAACTLTITPVNATGVSLNSASINLTVDEPVRMLTAVVTPSNATNKSIVWSSSDTSIATVKDGIVTAVSTGNCTITANVAGTNLSTQCAVTVLDTWIYPADGKLPDDIDNYVVEYQTHYRTISASAPGSDWIQGAVASSGYVNDGAQYESLDKLSTSATRVLVSWKYFHYCNLLSGANAVVNWYPHDAITHYDEFPSSWASREECIGNDTYDIFRCYWSNGDSITCKGGETCSGTHGYSCDVWYKKYTYQNKKLETKYYWTRESDWESTPGSGSDVIGYSVRYAMKSVRVTGITLDRTYIEAELEESPISLTATVVPANAANNAVIWYSSDANVADVSDGIVTLHKPGTVTVTCVAADGSGVSAKCEITIKKVSAVGIILNRQGLVMYMGDGGIQLTGTVLPENATNKKLNWESSDTSIATVDANGHVSYLRPGVVTITCVVADGSGVSASCRIFVKADGEMVLPASVTEIGDEAFMGIAVGGVVMQEGVTYIGSKAFADCPDLYFVYIPDSVTHIASDAFSGSPNVIFVCEAGSYPAYYAGVKGFASVEE